MNYGIFINSIREILAKFKFFIQFLSIRLYNNQVVRFMGYRELINYLGYENFYAGRCISPMLIERCEPVLEERYFSHKFLVKDSFRNNHANTVYIKNNGSKIYRFN